jgi:tRNA G37 N-methylase TrmD
MEILFMATCSDTYHNNRSYRTSPAGNQFRERRTHNWGNKAEIILIAATGVAPNEGKALQTMKRFSRFC